MSKIGKKPITLPKDVQVNFNDGILSVKGPKGQLERSISPLISVAVEAEKLTVGPEKGSASTRETATQWGLYRSLIQNMVKGVSEGFHKSLEFQGVGYKAVVKGSDLELSLGFSHPIVYTAPEGIVFKVEKNTIAISGIDRELVGQVAAEIRSKRKPEPYKGSGIRYSGEVIKKKAGKKAITAGA